MPWARGRAVGSTFSSTTGSSSHPVEVLANETTCCEVACSTVAAAGISDSLARAVDHWGRGPE